ncbi:ABC transporter permease [Halobacteriales archaeon QH_7_69_31]|nr:MAG: ABC transporter permease [Halobacteriales archaeon QH_7_69_31]
MSGETPHDRRDVDGRADVEIDAEDDGGLEAEEVEARVGLSYTLVQLRRDPTALAGLAIISVSTAVAIVASIDALLLDYWLTQTFWYHPELGPHADTNLPPYGVSNQYYDASRSTLAHPLGTDFRGRDVAVRLFYGTRIAITVGFTSTVIGLVGGTLTGAVAGYYGGWIDDVLMRGAEILYAIPFLILVIVIVSVLDPQRQNALLVAMVGVGIASMPTFARLIRSRVFSVREEEYVEAAKAAGVKDRWIILRHVIPNSFAPVLVQATLQIGLAILIIAGLSFLGFGAQPPQASWGQMLNKARPLLIPNPWFSIFPGLCILFTVVGFNLLGDGLRDAADPRIQN